MSGNIFISYRQDDSAAYAGWIAERLEQEFGRGRVFRDVDSIPLGEDFEEVLRKRVADCDVLLAVIGSNWLDARLENPADFVRIEIVAALQRNIPVIPMLIESSKIPERNQLPEDLRGITLRQGLPVRHASFKSDMEKLIGGLKQHVKTESAVRVKKWIVIVVGVLVLFFLLNVFVGLIFGWEVLHNGAPDRALERAIERVRGIGSR